jgi:hypothetical protein
MNLTKYGVWITYRRIGRANAAEAARAAPTPTSAPSSTPASREDASAMVHCSPRSSRASWAVTVSAR